ncbi:hypothetical protein K8I28_05235, partial [bacterium]|nr:hypothetical protein [bacterium]
MTPRVEGINPYDAHHYHPRKSKIAKAVARTRRRFEVLEMMADPYYAVDKDPHTGKYYVVDPAIVKRDQEEKKQLEAERQRLLEEQKRQAEERAEARRLQIEQWNRQYGWAWFAEEKNRETGLYERVDPEIVKADHLGQQLHKIQVEDYRRKNPMTPERLAWHLPVGVEGEPPIRKHPPIRDDSGELVPTELLDEYGRLKRPKRKKSCRYHGKNHRDHVNLPFPKPEAKSPKPKKNKRHKQLIFPE